MRILIWLLVIWNLILGATYIRNAYAQSGPSVIVGNGPHATCPVSTAGSVVLCIATDSPYLWVSANGGAYAGVSTPGGVTSVNGKTGVVVISASSTTSTTLN